MKRKLILNKLTIARLTKDDMSQAAAGNIWDTILSAVGVASCDACSLYECPPENTCSDC